jgi:hypothetical protein
VTLVYRLLYLDTLKENFSLARCRIDVDFVSRVDLDILSYSPAVIELLLVPMHVMTFKTNIM